MPSVGLNAVVGRPLEEYGMEPNSLEQMRKGVYNVHARIDDMNANGVAASLNFGTCVGFDGGRFHKAPDKTLSLIHLRAYNDWHIDEWCGAYPGRFIPCGLLPTWDMDATRRGDQAHCQKRLHGGFAQRKPHLAGTAQRAQRVLGTHVESHHRPRHDHVPAHRRRQPGSACVHGNTDRGLDHDHADVQRDRRGRLAEPLGAGTLSDA